MFEDALLESSGLITTKSRYFSIAAIVINGSALMALIVWPLLHPFALPKQIMSILLVAPAPPVAPAPIVTTSAPRVIHASSLVEQLLAPSHIPTHIAAGLDELPHDVGSGLPGATNAVSSLGSFLDGGTTSSRPVVKAALPVKIAISSGVMAGNKIAGENPSYPAIAKSARIAGAVVLAATISKTGAIQNLRVTSGPPMLTASALNAVKTWRYRPYLLNGEPVEVDTTINVIFSLGN